MSFNTMAFLIVTVSLIAWVLTTAFGKGGDVSNGVGSQKKDGIDKKLDDLERAIKILDKRLTNVETIVTSKDYDLEQEFKGLHKEASQP